MTIRRKNNSISYELEATLQNEIKYFNGINNLEQLASVINSNFFSNLPVVSRAMLSNWIYYPERPRRSFGDCFKINKVKASL